MKDQQQAKKVALAGLALQAVLTVAAVILWRMTAARSLLATFWYLLGCLPLWAVTALLFYARQVEAREQMELEQLAESGRDTRLFDRAEQGELHPAAARVRFLQRWIVPMVTVLLAAYHGAIGILLLRGAGGEIPPIDRPGQAAALLVVLGFGAFLFSRYCTGMSKRSDWTPLRAPGGYLLLGAIFAGVTLVALLFAGQGNTAIERTAAYLLPGAQLILAIELGVNFILNFYRPRMPGSAYAPVYDSRLLNLLAEPQRVGHSIADTLNYQFGFEVSKTWFYQLISSAFVPLVLFGAAVMFLMSSLVLVADGETYVVKTWGRLGEQRTLGPGLHLKWPWPVSTAEPFDTGAVHEIVLGLGEEKQPQYTRTGSELILWTEEHGMNARKEEDFLIGIPPREQAGLSEVEGGAGKAPAVSIIKLVVLVRYKVKDVFRYGYQVTDVRRLLRCLAENEMVKYVATATLDTPLGGQSDRPEALMTFGRSRAAEALRRRIQQRAEENRLGVEISYVGIVSAHPPSQAVPQYEKVLETERLQDRQRYQAQADAAERLAEVSGNPIEAMELYLALRKSEVFTDLRKKTDRPTALRRTLQEEIRSLTGQIEAFEMELQRERLLGKAAASLAARRRLQQHYQAFLDELQKAANTPLQYDYTGQIDLAERRVTDLFERLQGTPARQIAEARAYRWRRELRELTDVQSYRRKLQPYLAAPRVYMFDKYLDVLDERLPALRKYVLGVDPDRVKVWLNLQEQRGVLEAGLEAMGEEQE